MLTNSKTMLEKALKNQYAVGAFNFTNLEELQAILNAAGSLNSDVIVQASKSAIDYIGLSTLVSMVKSETENLKINVCLNLDHSKTFELCKNCIDAGFTNVMIDASDLSFEDNVNLTKQVVLYAHKHNVTVESELGALKGIEDEIKSAENYFTVPEEALKFVKLTGVDSLAVSIGTSHGAYKFKGASKLDITRLKQIESLVNLPLVLHGASALTEPLLNNFALSGGVLNNAKGVDEKQIQNAIKNGITKVNTDTDLRIAFTSGVREALKDKSMFNLREYLACGKEKVQKLVEEKIKLFGSQNSSK